LDLPDDSTPGEGPGGDPIENEVPAGDGGLNNETGGLLAQSDHRFVDDRPPDVSP
jgi:hypothetical protein